MTRPCRSEYRVSSISWMTAGSVVASFAKPRPNVMLSLLDDDHQLIASLPRMWTDMRAFLELDE